MYVGARPLNGNVRRMRTRVSCLGVAWWLAMAVVPCEAAAPQSAWSVMHPAISRAEAINLAEAAAVTQGYGAAGFRASFVRYSDQGIWIITLRARSNTSLPALGAIVDGDTGAVRLVPEGPTK